jgi:predicted DNA-binding protein with PD1-like motif
MKTKLIHESGGQRTFALVFETGDEAAARLAQFARDHRVTAAQFTAIGAFSGATLAYFDWETKQYQKFTVDEQVEVLTLAGDVSEAEGGGPQVHAHVVVGRRDGSTRGGHLIAGHVRPTLEVVLVESPAHLRRRHDPATGLALIRL